MLRILKPHLEVINLAISSIAGLASVLIAFFAYQIDRTVQERADREARMGRSVALAQSLFEDENVKGLYKIGSNLESLLNSISGKNDQVGQYKLLQARMWAEKMNSEADIVFQISTLLQHVDRALSCMNIDAPTDNAVSSSENVLTRETEPEDVLCDRKTLFSLAGNVLTDLYVFTRPVLTCDEFFAKRELEDYKTFVSNFYKHKANEKTLKSRVYVDAEAAGVDTTKIMSSSNDYISIAFGNSEYCATYREAREGKTKVAG